jgi:SAM-dependent methyltransferase
MLEAARVRFADTPDTTVISHDLEHPLTNLAGLGTFDLIVSSFAIHHVSDERKKALYREVFELLTPGGVFCNLEHVASPTPALHAQFYIALGTTVEESEDPSNQLAPVEAQLDWLCDAGFEDVDCFWKWRELALLAGRKPAPSQVSDMPTGLGGKTR